MRIGIGYDAHRLVAGRELVVGGVQIPHETGLDGHSDADVLVHAIMDALLGAANMGDIGVLFQPTDAAYKDTPSLELLLQVYNRVAAEYIVVNIDSVIIAEAPKMRPYIPQMSQNIAQVLGIPPARVSVKATTEERMGYTGRREGICAQAVCLLEKIEETDHD